MATREELNRAILERRLKEFRQQDTFAGMNPPIITSDAAQELVSRMKGRLPLQGSEKQIGREMQAMTDPRLGGGGVHTEVQRKQAYQELIKGGYTRDDIIGHLAFEKAIKPPSKMGRTIGSFAFGLIGSQLIPGPFDEAWMLARAAKKGGWIGNAIKGISQMTVRAGVEGAGGMVGEALQMAADPDAEWNMETLNRLKGAGKEEFFWGFGGETLGAGGRWLTKGTSKPIADAMRLSKKLESKGKALNLPRPTRFLPAQYSNQATIDTIQGIGENSLIGSDNFLQYKLGQTAAATFLIDDMSDAMSKGAMRRSPDAVAELLQDAVEANGIAHKVAAQRLYDVTDIRMTGETVNLANAAKKGRELLERAEKAFNIAESPTSTGLKKTFAGMGEEASETRDFLELLSGLKKAEASTTVNWETAKDIRSRLLKLSRTAQSKFTPDILTDEAVSSLVSSVDEAMGSAAKSAGPDAYHGWRRANTFYKAGKDRFENKTLKTLVRNLSDPALSKPDAADVIFKSKHNILRVKKAVGDEAFQQAKGAWVANIIRKSGKVDPTAARAAKVPIGIKMLNEWQKLDPEGLAAAFAKKEIENFEDTARILAIIQSKTGGQAGALRFVQGAAAAGIITAPLAGKEMGQQITKGSGILLLGPAVLGRMMTTPWFNKMLSEGYRIQPGTQQAVELNARLIRNVLQIRKDLNRERAKARQQAQTDPAKYHQRLQTLAQQTVF